MSTSEIAALRASSIEAQTKAKARLSDVEQREGYDGEPVTDWAAVAYGMEEWACRATALAEALTASKSEVETARHAVLVMAAKSDRWAQDAIDGLEQAAQSVKEALQAAKAARSAARDVRAAAEEAKEST